MDALDAYRAANMVIKQYGEGARAHAAQRIADMREIGDAKGEWAWLGVLDAVLELQKVKPGTDAVH